MVDTIEEVMNQVIGILRKDERGLVPKPLIERVLSEKFSAEEIEQAIKRFMETTAIDLVVDYPSPASSLDEDRLVWHLRLLSSDERAELESLLPIRRALIRILQSANHDQIGTLSLDETRTALEAAGFKDDRVEWLCIEGRVDTFRVPRNDQMMTYFRLIPEYEKTEEYKKEREVEEAEWIQHDMEMQAFMDRIDAETDRAARTKERRKKK